MAARRRGAVAYRDRVAGSNWRAQLGRLAVAVVREGARTLSRGSSTPGDGTRRNGPRSSAKRGNGTRTGSIPARAPLPRPARSPHARARSPTTPVP